MSDIEKIILTACATLIGGVILLILAELLKSFIMSPIQKLKEQAQIVLSKIDFHSNMLTNFFSATPSKDELSNIRTIRRDLREAATELKSKYKMIPFKRFMHFLRFIPSNERIDVAYRGLIYLHNSILYKGDRDYIVNLIDMNHNQIERIRAALTNTQIPEQLKPKERK